MTITKGNRVVKAKFIKALMAIYEDELHVVSGKDKKLMETATIAHFQGAVDQLMAINSALLSNAAVFAAMQKIPRQPQSGPHEYRLYWVTKDRRVENFLVNPSLFPLFGMYTGGVFRSSSVTRNRVIDATDRVFQILKRITGTYAQIEAA